MSSDGAEVAEDYRLALEDLSSNMRFEISNLTVIARENTEHALAIAEVLQQHILKVGEHSIRRVWLMVISFVMQRALSLFLFLSLFLSFLLDIHMLIRN